MIVEVAEEFGPTFSKLQATVKAWFPSRRSQAMATQFLPTIAMQEPWMRVNASSG